MFPSIIMPDVKPRIVPKLPLPKYSRSTAILDVTLHPHPRLKAMINGTTSHIIPAVTWLKRNRPAVIRTKLAAKICLLPSLSLSQPLLRRPPMLATGSTRATRLDVDLAMPRLLK
jgi:hypothetical protein